MNCIDLSKIKRETYKDYFEKELEKLKLFSHQFIKLQPNLRPIFEKKSFYTQEYFDNFICNIKKEIELWMDNEETNKYLSWINNKIIEFHAKEKLNNGVGE
jgi:hypothetical protein